MKIDKRKPFEVNITKVKKNIERRRNWGKWQKIRAAVLELAENETIKVGPFDDEKLAYLTRNNCASGGVRETLKSKGFVAVTEVTTEDGMSFCYIQKIKRPSGE